MGWEACLRDLQMHLQEQDGERAGCSRGILGSFMVSESMGNISADVPECIKVPRVGESRYPEAVGQCPRQDCFSVERWPGRPRRSLQW